MQQRELINFHKEREVGEILSDSFSFIRQNFKPLSKILLKGVGPILLLFVIAFTAYNFIILKGSNEVLITGEIENRIGELTSRFATTFAFGILFLMVVSLLFYSMFFSSINFAVQSYIENKGEIDVEEVTQKSKEKWFGFFGLALLGGIMMFFGMMALVIPGIYLFVPLSIVFSIMAFRGLTISESISYSFKLIRGSWWKSFLILFLMYLIYWISSFIFQIPLSIYTFIRTFVAARSDNLSMDTIMDWPYYILSALSLLVRLVLYGFIIITTTFLYFSLNEKRNRTGVFETIENLGE